MLYLYSKNIGSADQQECAGLQTGFVGLTPTMLAVVGAWCNVSIVLTQVQDIRLNS